MTRLILLALLCLSCSVAIGAPNYPDTAKRFEYYNLPGVVGNLLVDKKTGCEYLVDVATGYVVLKDTCNSEKR